jgi:hypothetical protein
MAVEIYFCRKCDYQSETYNILTGFGCPKCYSHLAFGDPALSGKSSLKGESVQSRRARRNPKGQMNAEALALYHHFNDQLIEMKVSADDEYYRRKYQTKQDYDTRAEVNRRKLAAAPVVFHAFTTQVTEELDENERLFSGVEVSHVDDLDTSDYLDDSMHLERDLFDDIPFGELIAPSMW